MIDDDEEPNRPEPSSDQIEHAKEKAAELEAVAQKLGLYSLGVRLGTNDRGDGTVGMVLIADFQPGDVAWSDRILDPQANEMDEQFKDIAEAVVEDDFEDYRKRLEERLGGTDGSGSDGVG